MPVSQHAAELKQQQRVRQSPRLGDLADVDFEADVATPSRDSDREAQRWVEAMVTPAMPSDNPAIAAALAEELADMVGCIYVAVCRMLCMLRMYCMDTASTLPACCMYVADVFCVAYVMHTRCMYVVWILQMSPDLVFPLAEGEKERDYFWC